jgi:hypothetical protein
MEVARSIESCTRRSRTPPPPPLNPFHPTVFCPMSSVWSSFVRDFSTVSQTGHCYNEQVLRCVGSGRKAKGRGQGEGCEDAVNECAKCIGTLLEPEAMKVLAKCSGLPNPVSASSQQSTAFSLLQVAVGTGAPATGAPTAPQVECYAAREALQREWARLLVAPWSKDGRTKERETIARVGGTVLTRAMGTVAAGEGGPASPDLVPVLGQLRDELCPVSSGADEARDACLLAALHRYMAQSLLGSHT